MKNNWYVITGAPCSGKTTLLKQLEKKGFKVIYEVARNYIDEEIKKGKTLSEIRKDEVGFQDTILKLKIELERLLPKNEVTFIERGIPDSLAYFKTQGIKIHSFLENAVHNSSYKKVFLFDILPYKKDYARTEDVKLVQRIQKLLHDSYQSYGFTVIKVPRLTIKRRLKFLLENL